MAFDTERINTTRCHVNQYSELVNSRDPNSPSAAASRRGIGLLKYFGTCGSTPLLILPGGAAARYWEARTEIHLKNHLQTLPILEVGLLEETVLDDHLGWICRLPRSWCVRIAVCESHRKRICTQVWGEGRNMSCLPEPEAVIGTIPNEAGVSTSVGYGVVVDIDKGKIGFIDLDRDVVLQRFDVDFRETVYPIFAVGSFQDKVDVKMRLLSEDDIVMTHQKRLLIRDALSDKYASK